MSLPYSDAFFVQVFPRECTETFQAGHQRAFEFFGGVPRRISYDNSRIAVAKFVGKRGETPTREFLRLQSHYLFAHHFCLVRRPMEKGHTEHSISPTRRGASPHKSTRDAVSPRAKGERFLNQPIRHQPCLLGGQRRALRVSKRPQRCASNWRKISAPMAIRTRFRRLVSRQCRCHAPLQLSPGIGPVGCRRTRATARNTSPISTKVIWRKTHIFATSAARGLCSAS